MVKINHSEESNIAYRIFIALGIYGCAYYFLFKPLTIGNSFNYNLIVVWIPLIFGLFVSIILRRNFLKRLFTPFKANLDNILTSLFLLLMGLMYSYLSFGVTTEIIFHVISKHESNGNVLQSYVIPIEKVSSIRRSRSFFSDKSIHFKFNNHSENIKIGDKLYFEIKDLDLEDLKIGIECREGLFGVYYVKNWEIHISE
jgi:hypothetical protein